MKMFCRGLIFLMALMVLLLSSSQAQQKWVIGLVKDGLSDEPIPFASVKWMGTGQGKLTDTAGRFLFRMSQWPSDSLEITYVGYKDYRVSMTDARWQKGLRGDTLFLVIGMDRGKSVSEVVVKRKIDRGLLMWKRIVKRKPYNSHYAKVNFSYELHNKLELDINRFNKDKVGRFGLVKPFSFILNNVDSSEGVPYLPIYFAETISDYFYQKSPFKTREIIKASKTDGLENESVSKLLGGTDANVNIYNDFIPVFDKQFVSPISDQGDNYYQYRVADTQYVNGQRLIHLIFTPKRKGENTFEGDCWVHDPTWAIQKMNLFLGPEANINFINKLSLVQEFRRLNDTTWFLSKDKFVFDIAPIGKNSLGFIGRKTTTYQNVSINTDQNTEALNLNQIKQEVIFLPSAREQKDAYWQENRHEALSRNEKAVYQMIDTLNKMPLFKRYSNTVNFLATGYTNVGNFEIGPWYNWIWANALQGFRPRFDLGTNKHFSKQWYLHGYLAYGFGNQEWNGKFEVLHLLNKNPRSYIHASITSDYDNGQVYYDEVSQDNLFALAVRKNDVPIKFLHIEEQKLEYFKEWKFGLGVTTTFKHKRFDPVLNIPPRDLFIPPAKGDVMTTTEATIKVRFGYQEKFLEGNFYRISLGSAYPVVEMRYTRGIQGVFNSGYNYSKFYVSVSDFTKRPPLGSFYYNVFAGRTYGTAPYPMLDIIPGNEIYYYNKYAFSLMNRFEYLADRYAGFNIEHNLGAGLFRFLPITRKMKIRQFWNVKAITTSLTPENYQMNVANTGGFFKDLSGKTYMEVGTGIDNIIRFIRLDFVWRVLPTPRPVQSIERFGVFFSFRLSF